MQSFRLYRAGAIQTPARTVSDYTPEEIAGFHIVYAGWAQDYRKRLHRAYYGIAGFFLCIVLMACVQKPYFWFAGISCWLFIMVTAPTLPKCPGCLIDLGARLGAFCPECGSPSLQPGSWFRAPKCDACGKTMSKGSKGRRRYTIHACTHCGLMLDEKGL